jgi:hypothetical protein
MTESAEALKSDVTPAGGHFCGAQLVQRLEQESLSSGPGRN